MATFRSGVKILSQVSKRQGYRSFQLRSYSDDRRTTFHRSRSPFWTTNNSKTPLQTSKSWFSLFHRKKSPENKLLTHESGCDLKETCQSESTKNESWLSFLKKKVSKDNRPPLTCCRMHQARLRKEEEQKALQEGREPEGWKSDVEIVTKESNAPVMCKTPTEPQPQPPPQPPPPRAVEVLKENVEKLSSKTDMAISSKSFNTRQPYEEFKIPIQSAPPPPVSGENLQPRKQSPYTTGDKFREGTNFQQCKKFHKQSNLETGSLTKIKSKHLHKSTIAQRKGKTTGVLKPAKVLNNKTLNILHTSSLLKEVKTSSKIIIPTKIQNTNSPQVLVNEIKAIKPTNISNKTLAPNKDHDSSKNLASEPPLQNVPNTATSGQVIHLDVINEKNKTQLQSDLLEVKLKLDNEVIQSTVCTRTKERKPTTKLSSKITQRRNNLKISTIRQAVNKDNCMHSNIKNKEVNSGIKDNPTLTNKYLNLGLNRSGERSTQKSVPSSIKSSCSSSKKDNKCTQEFSPSKNETRSIKSSTNLNNITNNTASSKITSSHSLPNINKNSKHNEERTSLKKAGRSIKTSSTPNNKPKPVEKLSKTNIKSETSTKVKTKEGCEQIKTDNTKSIRPNDESFISAWKENYSYVSFPRKARIPKKKENLKLTQKGNEDVYQLSLPSNIQPFVRLGEGVHLWSTPDPVQVQSPHNQKQTIKSVRKAPKLPTEEKEPWFTECQTNYVDTDFPEKRYSISKSGTNMRKSNNGLIGNKFTQDEYPKPSYAKILKYGNRNVLNSKLNNKAKSQKEKFLSSYFSFGVVNDDLNPKVKRKDEDVKQGRFVESKLVGTNYRKDQHIKQKSHSEITNYLKDTKEIKSHKQDEISIDDSVYISDMSVPIPCQSQMEESSMNDQYGSLLYAKDNFGDDFNSAKTRDKSNYYRQPYEHDKNMDASLSNIHCKNLMTDSSIQPPHSNHRNLTNDSLPDMKSPNVTEKHIPFSYEKSYGHWSILESDPTDEQQVDPHIENVIVTLPKPCSSGACLTNSRQFPNKMVKQTFSSYVGSSSCNQSCMSHNQEMEQLVHKHIKKSKYNMLANPEMSFKKNKQYIKNKRQKITGDNVKYYDCVNAETLKLKNGLSKTPMSYTKQNVIVQQFLPNRRYYSSYTSNKTSSLCKVLNRIITQNNEYLKYTGKNLLSTVPSKTIQRSPKHARKNQNTSSQAAANHAPKYFSKGQGNYSLLQKIHSDSEIHTLRRNDFNNKQAKQFTTENPVKQNPPLPSFAEYIEDPKTETKNIGNEEKVKNKFLESKNVKTLNINNTKNQQIQLSSPRENHKEKKQKTEEDLIQGNFSNDKEDKLGMLTFTKLPIKCSATQYLIGQQDQLMHSQSSFKLNSLQPPTIQYNNAPQYARHASSYSYIKPFNYGNKSKMLCSSSKDSKSEPPSCGKVDSGVKKEKSKKSCNKVTAPGCKAPKSVDCVIIKELPPCKKVCAPKKSYSECIREQTPPRPFTECLIRKPDICPGQKPVEKSYDGCAKKKKEIECPEPVIEKPIKPKKKVRDVCDPKEECDDVEPFKFKSGYSRPPMKCSSKNPSMSQPNLPPVRSYSNLKTVLPEKPKIPTRSSSYINFQIKNLKEREYSSTEKTVPESKLFEFEAKSSTRDPEPAQTFRRSSIRSYETSMSPDKISLKKDDQIVGSLKQSSLKIQSTHGNILKRKKEVKPQTNPLVLREDQYVKISLRHPEISPQKKKTISDTPFNLSTEPCLGQKHEKVLRKTSAVYPGYSALSITKNKRDKEKKFTKNPTDTSTLSNILSTYSESAKKYSTSKVQDDQNLSKAYNIPEFFSSKTVLTMINFPPPTIKMKKDTINNKKLKVPVTLKTSSINVTGNLSSTKRKSKIKSRTSLSKNFSPSSKTIKNNSTNNKFMSSVHSNDVKISVSFSKQNTNKKHCQENVIPIKDFLYKTSKNKDSNLNKIQVHSSLSNLPITVKNNVSSTILNYKLEACNVNSSPKINSLRNEPLMKFQTSTLKWNNETNQSKNQTKTSTINNYVISRKHDFDSTASTSMIRHEALQSSKIICETARNKEGTKENDENISSNLSNPSEELADLSNKTDYIVTTNRDGNVEDLFTTIKSWFSFLKTKEGLPQSDNKITENQIVVSPCETNHVNELPSESLLENTRERQCGSDISNSLQSGKTGYECKDFSSPEPFISEYAKSHSLAECYPENLANEADATFIKPSACEMYFTKNKKVAKTKLHTSSMRTNHQENIILEGGRKSMLPTKLAKHQNSKIVTPEKLRMSHERSELPTSAETYPSNGKINIFSELLNKKSTLQEWQEEYPKHINPQFDMKTHSKLNEAINKFTKVNNHVQDKIQAAYEDKVFSSGNTTETLNQESISGPLKIDKEIVVMKQNEKIQELESDKPTFFHNDNLQLSKMSNSISPSNKELGCTIKDKNASPHPFVKIRPNNCSIHSREVTFKVKGINHTRAKKVIKAHNRLSKRKNKHIPFKQAKSNRHQSENSANTDTPKYSFDAYKEINIKTKESPATSNSYVALINKFPDIMGRNIGNNSFSDIWSCHQKELPVNFILKVQDPIYPKANPKLDLKVLKPVSHDVEAECKEIEDHQSQSSNKVSQRKNMAKECSSVKTNPGSNTVKYVLPCLGLHNRPCKILLNTFNLFPLCSCYDKYKQFLMVPSLVHISPRHKSMIPKRGSDELCTEKSDAKNNSSGSGTPNETCKKNNKLGYVECEEPPKKEKPTCEKETRPKDVCPPIKRPIKMPCEKKETKKDVVKIEVNIEKEVKYEVKQEKKEPLTKEEIEARKKSFQVTKISPIKDPPPLPSCDSIAAKEVSIEILKPPNGEKPPPKSCEEESSSDICSKQCNGEGSPTVTNPPSNPCNDGGGGGKTS